MPINPRSIRTAILILMLLVAGWSAIARAGNDQIGRPAIYRKVASTDGLAGRSGRLVAVWTCKSKEPPCLVSTPH